MKSTVKTLTVKTSVKAGGIRVNGGPPGAPSNGDNGNGWGKGGNH